MSTKQNQQGVVSLFIVILSALLMTIITVAFVRIMLQDQLQATTIDLSKSALDSAYAGVEDAKRTIVQYMNDCSGGNSTQTSCTKQKDAFDAHKCTTLQDAGIMSDSSDASEVHVKQNDNDNNLEQAYTCLKVYLDTPNYLGSFTSSPSRLIHLKSNQDFNQVKIEWYSHKDLQAGLNTSNTSSTKVNLYPDANDTFQPVPTLPKSKDWPANRPALLRAQLLQFGNNASVPGGKGFMLSDFNNTENNSTLFLYPENVGIDSKVGQTASFTSDARRSKTSDNLSTIKCDQNFDSSGAGDEYACTVTINIPLPGGATNTVGRDAYLLLNEFYNTNTTYRVTLQLSNGGAVTPADFAAVQPQVDSTGRANDLFRRISSRIDLGGSSIPNIDGAVDISGSLCKTFLVTDQVDDYDDGQCSN
jgi:Tfp pilus assembly protein PilX